MFRPSSFRGQRPSVFNLCRGGPGEFNSGGQDALAGALGARSTQNLLSEGRVLEMDGFCF